MKNIALVGLSPKTLRKAATLAERIEVKRKALQADEAILAGLVGQPISFGGKAVKIKTGKGKRVMSAATKAKIAAGQKARWAARHATQGGGAPPSVQP